MAHLKVLTPVESRLKDLLDPLPTEEEVELRIEDPTEKLERLVLRRKVEEVVMRQAADKNLVFPPYLFDQAADQVLSVAKDEPCGLRGCVLIVVYVDPELGEQLLTKVKCDEAMPTTHLLVLRFHPDQTSWYTKMARIFRSLGKRKTVVSPKFELILDDFVSDVLKMTVPRR
ncbi:hypothetical protein Pmani_025362 [Petrolisthes manimaculis]|uniref:Uncharacterized protein n=1 Tax=Petrolisthes manimaculis TaxID=1843537 RepID=A0AAE1P837_9EUCA|nr:hypothetical protein Pmani_025362 [Petrolisthes manimaculis]